MPEERGYLRTTRPQAGAPMPMVSAESYGAGLGGAISQVAEQANRQNLRGYAIERQRTQDAEWSRFQHEFGLARDDMDRVTREYRKHSEPGHAQRVSEVLEQRREQLLGGLTEDTVRQRATAQFEEFGSRLHSSEADFEEVKRSEGVVRDYGAARDISANRIRRLERPEDYATEIELGHDAIAGLNLADDVKAKLHDEWDQVGGVSFLRGMLDRDPATAKAMLAQGLFDELDPDTVDQLLAGADVEIRRAAAAQEHAAALSLADFRERVRTEKERAAQGIDNAEALPGLISEARQLGLEDVAVDLEGVAADAGLARIYEGATPVQRERRIAELQARGEARSDAEDRELAWHERTIGAASSRFNSDPAGFYNGTSTPPPPLDFADPASLQARARWARAASSAAGRPVPPLTANEAASLGQNYRAGGRAGAVQVMDLLGALPADQAASAARMVDPNDAQLPVMVTLPQPYRQLALDGRDALKVHPKLTSSKADGVSADDAEAILAMDTRFTEALRSVPPAQRQAILQVANRLTAGAMDQTGTDAVSAGLYWNGLNMALGAHKRSDGKWEGGLAGWNEHWFALPDGVTRDAFVTGVQAAARDGIGAGKVKPINPDGSPAALSRSYPVLVGNGIYEFHTRQGVAVQGSDGRPWTVQVHP
jgi:hypothetical protein